LATLKSEVAALSSGSSSSGTVGVTGGSQSYDTAQQTYTAIFSNITDVYEKVRANRRDIDKKCPRTKCEKILNKVKKVKASVEFIQTMNLTMLEQMVEMLKNSSTAQQLLDLEPIKACMADPTASSCTGTYGGSTALPSVLASKCDSTTCDSLTSDLGVVKECLKDPSATACTSTYSATDGTMLPSVLASKCTSDQCTILTSNLTVVQDCFTDPTASGCTGTYSASTTLPALLAAKCDGTTCTTLQTSVANLESCLQSPTGTSCTSSNANGASGSLPAITATAISDLTSVKECMSDPTATACTATYGSSSSLPTVLASKCDGTTCTTLTSDLDVVKECFKDPSSSACTGTYSDSDGTMLPSVLSSKCTSTTCTTLTTSVTNLESCMATPTDTSCTSTTLDDTSASLPQKVTLLDTCMTTPSDAACTIKTTTTSVPYKVTNLDKCMESIDDATCTASYGQTSYYVSSGGKGMVGWIQQMRQPSVIQCSMAKLELTFPNTAANDATTGDLTTDGGTPTAISPGCDVAKIYEKLTFGTCTKSTQPNSADSFHMEPNTANDEVTVNQDGMYKVEFTALMKGTDRKLMRVEVFKITAKDPASNCASTTSECTTLIQLRTKTELVDDATNEHVGERTTNGEGVFSFCSDDRIFVIASKGGSTANNEGTITGDAKADGTNHGIRTILTVSKIGFT